MSQNSQSAEPKPPESGLIISQDILTGEHHPTFFVLGDGFIFQIENRLYRLPRWLLDESEFFRDMFEVASPHVGSDVEGLTDERPIRPAGVTKFQMNSLLTVLHASLLDGNIRLDSKQWIAVLQLSNKWTFQAAKEYAIGQIDNLKLDPITRIVLARECDVSKWLKPALVDLCARAQPLTSQEGEKIGLTTSLAIARVREKVLLKGAQKGQGTPFLYCSYCQRRCSCLGIKCGYAHRCYLCQRYCDCGGNVPGGAGQDFFPDFVRSELEAMVDGMAELRT